MKRVTGIGGIFFKAKDPKALGEWYRQHLGVEVTPWGGAKFKSEEGAVTVWTPFKEDTKYFAPSASPFMINYRVEDLVALIAVLKEEGIEVEGDGADSEYGRFAWVVDPEGNKAELWQPPAAK